MKKTLLRTTWNLGLMYKNHKDPQIEKDMKSIETLCDQFSKKWSKNQTYQKDIKVLLRALKDYEKLEDKIKDAKPLSYLYLAKDLDTGNKMISALLTKMTERIAKASNKIIFFELHLGKLNEKMQKEILSSSEFKHYHYFLRKIFDQSSHQLSEAEEKIITLKMMPSYQMWVDTNDKAIGKLTVKWKKKTLSIHEASGILPTLPRSQRAKLDALIKEQYKSIALIAEAELNAIVQDKKINDELRGYKHAYSATVLEYQNTELEVLNLIKSVSGAYPTAHKLYKLKAKLMGLPKLAAYDLQVDLKGSKQTFTFEQGVEIVRSAFLKVDPRYAKILDDYISNNQIDVYPRQGKQGGGYCWGGHGRPTYILLNWTDDLDSVMTLAHEMGHAIHGELSKSQGVLYSGHPISTAETASTLFENFVFEEIMQRLSPKERLYATYNKLQTVASTVFRQIAWFQAEQEIHEKVRTNGRITAEELTSLRRKHMEASVGKAVSFTKDDGWAWVVHSHIRYFFYVYSYAYGSLISTALYAKYQSDPTFIEKINYFLSAGESMSPYDIFKSIGIDTTKPDFWNIGLKSIDQKITELEKECKKLNFI
jgi:oligoendopeptidase F